MPMRNREYGEPRTCEYQSCERQRGAPLKSEYDHGCVLCTFHGNELQHGRISLPESASDERKQAAADQLLG